MTTPTTRTPRFEAYCNHTVREGMNPLRCWSVFEADDSEDGRLVGESMLEADAIWVAALLEAAR